ncbi:MAG: DUF892 family protein [Elusimicrobia bacterium]|nr:DUF892 family protein [Elusimicrobiota bacterium]
MNVENLERLLQEALETEKGGVRVYETALRCASNEELREEWERYLEQTKKHVDVVARLLSRLDFEEGSETPGVRIVRMKAEALIGAMTTAIEEGDRDAAQLVAAECVVDAETKDHQNWELIGAAARQTEGDASEALREAYEAVEDEEDEHLYHTMGWCRELWIQSLGMKAVLPPPEERKHVKTAIAAARAKASRGRMTRPRGGRRRGRRVRSAA